MLPIAAAWTPVLGPLCPFEIAALVLIAIGSVWWISTAVKRSRSAAQRHCRRCGHTLASDDAECAVCGTSPHAEAPAREPAGHAAR